LTWNSRLPHWESLWVSRQQHDNPPLVTF